MSVPNKQSQRDTYRSLIADNPMLNEATRAWRKLFRSGITGATVGLSLFFILYFWIAFQSYIGQSDNSIIFCYNELILMTLSLPVSIHNSISGERELATWDALILTRLTPGQIIVGKLIWRLRIALIIAALCLFPMCISRLHDNDRSITNFMMFSAQMVLISWGTLLCCFGLWVSSATKRSITTLLVIAATLIGLLIVLPALYNLFYALLSSQTYYSSGPGSDPVNMFIATFNPFASLMYLLNPDDPFRKSDHLPGSTTGTLQVLVYLAFSALFTWLTFLRLRGLEGPGGGKRWSLKD